MSLPVGQVVFEVEGLGLGLGLLGLLGVLLSSFFSCVVLLLLLFLFLVLVLDLSLPISPTFFSLSPTRTSVSLGTSISNWMAVSFLMNLIVRDRQMLGVVGEEE